MIVSPFSLNGEPVKEVAIGEKSGLFFSLFCVGKLFIPLILLLSGDNKLRFSFSVCSIFAFLYNLLSFFSYILQLDQVQGDFNPRGKCYKYIFDCFLWP